VTIKGAIKILDIWITMRKEKIKEVNIKFKELDSEIKATLLENEKTVIANLQLIRKELVPNYKHPKKMQDTCGGVKYCMSCNMDL